MKPLVLRLPVLFALTVFAALLLGAASVFGRGLDTKLAVVEFAAPQTSPGATGQIAYGMIDLDRGVLTRRRIAVPGLMSVQFVSDPALVLQSARVEGGKNWTLNTLDPARGILTPQVSMTTPSAVRLASAQDFTRRADGNWNVFIMETGDLYYSINPDADARRIVSTAPFMLTAAWSPDGTKMALPLDNGIKIMDADGGNVRNIAVSGGAGGVLRWSPDGRYILTSWQTRSFESPSVVVDTNTGETLARWTGRAPTWCGTRISDVLEPQPGVFEAHLTDPLGSGADETFLRRNLTAIAEAQRSISVSPVDTGSCDWFLVTAVGEGYGLLHRPSQTLIPLGINVQIQDAEVTADSFTVRVNVSSTTELRRVALVPPASHYDLLAVVKGLSLTLTWLDEERGALSLSRDSLVLIRPGGAQSTLIGADVTGFFVLK